MFGRCCRRWCVDCRRRGEDERPGVPLLKPGGYERRKADASCEIGTRRHCHLDPNAVTIVPTFITAESGGGGVEFREKCHLEGEGVIGLCAGQVDGCLPAFV